MAKDVCECLDLGNPSQAVARLEDDERCLISNESLRVNGDTVAFFRYTDQTVFLTSSAVSSVSGRVSSGFCG